MSLLLVIWQNGSLQGMPATLLSPGRVGMLLMVEVIVGMASAAILTDEQFGLRELSGTVLIISAGVVEVLRQQKIDKSGIVDVQLSP